MVRQISKFMIYGLSVLSAVSLSSLAFAPAASAFTFTDTVGDGDSLWDTVGITTNDINKSFEVNYNGSVEGKLVAGLSALTKYTFLGFTSINGDSFAEFDILVQNTSTGIESRVSAIGFDTNLTDKSGTTSGINPTTAVYSKVLTASNQEFPNGFGDIDVCITNGNTCQGGTSGGVTNYATTNGVQGSATFRTKIRVDEANTTSIALSNFGVRFQSINGNGYKDDSGTGKGWIKKPNKDPNKVPEPMTGAALLAVGAVAVMKKRQQASENA